MAVAAEAVRRAEALRIACAVTADGDQICDCGIRAPGGLEAGLFLARVCLSDLATVALVPGELDGWPLPHVEVRTDHPVAACLGSQYAGWAVRTGDFFAMGSGPMRAAHSAEALIGELGLLESPDKVVGVLETNVVPDVTVARYIAGKTGVAPGSVCLLAAPTASLAGGLQVVSRSVETALHKLHALGFELSRIVAGWGLAPLPPVARNDLAAMGRTNDCVLYGGRVVLWVRGDDASLESIGPEVPSRASPDFGSPFLDIFERYERDFYRIDPRLFSPAEVVFQNVETGSTLRFGAREPGVLRASLLG